MSADDRSSRRQKQADRWRGCRVYTGGAAAGPGPGVGPQRLVPDDPRGGGQAKYDHEP
jgi:hypothetical protein